VLRSPYKFGAQKQKVWLAPFFSPNGQKSTFQKTAQRESKRADAGVHRTKLGFKEIKRRSIVAGLRAMKAPAVSCSASWVYQTKRLETGSLSLCKAHTSYILLSIGLCLHVYRFILEQLYMFNSNTCDWEAAKLHANLLHMLTFQRPTPVKTPAGYFSLPSVKFISP